MYQLSNECTHSAENLFFLFLFFKALKCILGLTTLCCFHVPYLTGSLPVPGEFLGSCYIMGCDF